MDTTFFTDPSETSASAAPSWNLDEMVDQVRHSLGREVDPGMIRQTLLGILSDYGDARIRTFIPILACRTAKEILEEKQAEYQEQ
jgi:hypothetical protein